MYFETFHVLIEKIVYWLLMLNKLKVLIQTLLTLMRISENPRNPTYGKVRTMDNSFETKSFAHADGGPRSHVCARAILRSDPHKLSIVLFIP